MHLPDRAIDALIETEEVSFENAVSDLHERDWGRTILGYPARAAGRFFGRAGAEPEKWELRGQQARATLPRQVGLDEFTSLLDSLRQDMNKAVRKPFDWAEGVTVPKSPDDLPKAGAFAIEFQMWSGQPRLALVDRDGNKPAGEWESRVRAGDELDDDEVTEAKKRRRRRRRGGGGGEERPDDPAAAKAAEKAGAGLPKSELAPAKKRPKAAVPTAQKLFQTVKKFRDDAKKAKLEEHLPRAIEKLKMMSGFIKAVFGDATPSVASLTQKWQTALSDLPMAERDFIAVEEAVRYSREEFDAAAQRYLDRMARVAWMVNESRSELGFWYSAIGQTLQSAKLRGVRRLAIDADAVANDPVAQKALAFSKQFAGREQEVLRGAEWRYRDVSGDAEQFGAERPDDDVVRHPLEPAADAAAKKASELKAKAGTFKKELGKKTKEKTSKAASDIGGAATKAVRGAGFRKAREKRGK